MIRPTKVNPQLETAKILGIWHKPPQKTKQPTRHSLIGAISAHSTARYKQPPKALHSKALMYLALGKMSFLLSGTRFGKSHFAKIYYDLLPIKDKGVLLVINPLGSLGNNQVLEIQKEVHLAINFNKLTFNPHEPINIANGK
ncbi:uncharacterized protein VP01_120g4 [Puccinia sorghi]|uniref:Uncharacterized protein n=1 Tax=Puccinia sorghi TaxID=27349 RepID=A0A0L6VQC4_9BASI|nr:uncharacterized protein VP01_120g4 [Puccinia sorghi]